MELSGEWPSANVSDSQRGLYFVHSNNYSDLNVELLLPTEDNSFEEQMTSRVHFTNRVATRDPIIADITGDGVLDVQSVLEPIEKIGREESDYLRIWKTWDATAPWKISTVCSKTAPMATPLCCRSIVWIRCAISCERQRLQPGAAL